MNTPVHITNVCKKCNARSKDDYSHLNCIAF